VMAKTEGNGCVNDHTRGYTTFAMQVFLSEVLRVSRDEVARRVAFVMSGGTEGVLSPHATVFTRDTSARRPSGSQKRFAVGVEHTRDLLPEEIGRATQVHEVAAAVRRAMSQAGIDSESDVHFVQVKCPLISSEHADEARGRGADLVTTDTYESMGYSRAASALGVALAVREIHADAVTNDVIGH